MGRITSKDFSFTISEDPKIAISTTSLAAGVVGKTYNKTVSAKVSGIEGNIKWTKSGTLPNGLKLTYERNKAVLSGTPTKKGTYDFTLKASYKDVKDSKSFTVTVTQTTLSGTVSDGVVKASYSKKFTASDGTKPYTWTKSGTLPNGLKLKGSNASATLSGTPTKAGKFTFTIKVTDANNKAASKSYTVNITKPEITGSLSDGVVKAKYSGTLKVSGGTKSYTWTTSGTLPNGLTFKGSNTKATITGKPTKAGSYKFKVAAKDANGVSSSKSFTINVTKTTIDGTLNDGVIKTKYSGTLKASGGTKPYTWSTSGTLPTGLTFKGANTKATISGTPKTAGSYKFKVTLEDSNGAAMSKSFTIKIAAANSKASKDESSNEIENKNISTYEIFDNSVENENDENDFSSSIFRTSLEIVSEDILSKGEGKDEDIVDVKANSPVTFKLGEWKYANGTKAEISDAIVYIDDNATEISISDEGLFTIPAEFVKDDFKVSVEAQNGALESEELFISAIE